MSSSSRHSIPSLLIANLPRELILGVEESFIVGAQRAFKAAAGMDEGHLPSIVGQLRHFHMNEAFHRVLLASESSPSSIRGNNVVTGRAGIFTLARFNIKTGLWANGRRSQIRKQMSVANLAMEPLVQPGLFSEFVPPSEGVVFFVACFSASLKVQPDVPSSVHIAVPDRNMSGWLFREPVGAFLKRYDVEPETQQDSVIPTLKRGVAKALDQSGG
jgi:hypothetical protein